MKLFCFGILNFKTDFINKYIQSNSENVQIIQFLCKFIDIPKKIRKNGSRVLKFSNWKWSRRNSHLTMKLKLNVRNTKCEFD